MLMEFVKPKELVNDRCPACREKALKAIGVDPDDSIYKNNIVVQCGVCGSISKLNRVTLTPEEVRGEERIDMSTAGAPKEFKVDVYKR